MKSGTNKIDDVNIYDEIHLTISDHIGIFQGLKDSTLMRSLTSSQILTNTTPSAPQFKLVSDKKIHVVNFKDHALIQSTIIPGSDVYHRFS